jgi:FkbM family methyltransferase
MYFDIGANIGQWALANVNNCDKIVAVEASPFTFRELINNCKNNKIVLVNRAVCNNNGNDITFYQANCNVLSTINKNWLTDETSRFNNEPYNEITCKTITIDSLIEKFGVPKLIKIDVEGGEYSCVTSLTQKVETLCFEWASEVNDITFNCLNYLITLGFKKFYLQFEDNYIFIPNECEYYEIDVIKEKLKNTTPKLHWGMVWCK